MAADAETEVRPGRRRGFARGPALLAGGLVGTAGLLEILSGIDLLTTNPYVVMTDDGMIHLRTTGWSQLHLLLGVGVLIAGLVIATGRIPAVLVGLCLILAGAAVDLLFLPFDPLEGVLALGFQVAALVVLFRHRPRRSSTGADRLTGSRRPAR